jgi:hypothetical protein
MVGELELAIADQTATIEFVSDHVLVRFADYKTARTMVSKPMPSLNLVGQLLGFSNIGLKAQVGSRKPIELFPQPSWLVRWLSPTIREMVYAAEI